MVRHPLTRRPAARAQEAATAIMSWLGEPTEPRSSAPTQAPAERRTEQIRDAKGRAERSADGSDVQTR